MNHATRVYESIVEMLSNVDNPTPLVRLCRTVPLKHARVYAKLEWYNPFGAVKDRVAANLLKDAEARGQLSPGTRLVEPTSGNTGVGLAMLANAKGYGFTATMSNKVPAEKRAALRLFGTDLRELEDDLCPAPGAPEGAIALAAKLGEEPGSFHLNQYKNPANPEAHYLTTGPEVWRQTDGAVTHFFASLGTCGTVTGTGRFLKEHKPSVKVFGVHPMEGHDVPGVRSIRQLQQTALFAPNEYDGLIEVNNADAYEWTRRLNQEESIVAGPSSGLTLAGALRHIPDEPGVVAVVMFADNVYKYMSSVQKHIPDLFKGAKRRALGCGLVALEEHALRRAQPRGVCGGDRRRRREHPARFALRWRRGPALARRQGRSDRHLVQGGRALAPRARALEGPWLPKREERARRHERLVRRWAARSRPRVSVARGASRPRRGAQRRASSCSAIPHAVATLSESKSER
jgi:cysteine synthase